MEAPPACGRPIHADWGWLGPGLRICGNAKKQLNRRKQRILSWTNAVKQQAELPKETKKNEKEGRGKACWPERQARLVVDVKDRRKRT